MAISRQQEAFGMRLDFPSMITIVDVLVNYGIDTGSMNFKDPGEMRVSEY